MLTLRSLLVVFLLAGCSRERPMAAGDGGGSDGGTPPVDSGTVPMDSGPPPPFMLTSSAYAEGEMVPTIYECGPPLVADGPGDNVSPPLAWTAGPSETMSYAIVMRDVDAGSLVHWVIYDIPSSVLALPEGVPDGYEPRVPAGAKQAELQGSGYYGYFGPCSPGRVNTYVATVHALDTPMLGGVTSASTEDEIAAAVEAASIAQASLSGES